MVRVRFLSVFVILVALVSPAAAELCTIDAVPAATILVPYFEVDLRNAGRGRFERTKITLINTSPAPTVAHVILWTEHSFPTLNFDIFLTGFDVQEFDVDRLFTDFRFPVGGSFPDVDDFDFSECTVCRGGHCENISPGDDFTRRDLVAAHTGSSVDYYDGRCVARSSGRVARGYITIDAADECSRLYPFDDGYFESGGMGVATNDNILTATITTYSNKFMREVPAFHIEAGLSNGLSTEGNYTFYGRYVGYDASDNRECGATLWEIPYRKENRFKTQAIVWRDSGSITEPHSCGSNPDWYPLGTSQLVIWDQQENSRELGGLPFPAETQLVSVGKRPLNSGSFDSGWAWFDLRTTVPSMSEDEIFGHGYVMARQRYRAREGDAPASQFTRNPDNPISTVCGGPVSEAVRFWAQQARKTKNAGKSSRPKKKRARVDPDLPRPRRPE
ncbi:MAG: hypothetical protein ACE5GX_02720 [Thermoanaerobaculia bacterium]